MVAACANAVIATTAVIAAWYALRQYRYAVRIQDINQVLLMYQAFRDMSRHTVDDSLNERLMTEVIDLLTVHERLLAEKLLSKHATSFYRDAVAIQDTFSDVDQPQLDLLRKILRSDTNVYRHFIATLKSNAKTNYIVNW
ncbi:hypothetical protein ASD32_07155 [Rhizobium sp. Root483D2]|nr:hypothetical protein ASD32_07155 [Rhizobium sp. Root483D2]